MHKWSPMKSRCYLNTDIDLYSILDDHAVFSTCDSIKYVSTITLSSLSAYLLPCTHRAVLEANVSHRVLPPPTTIITPELVPQTLRLN